MKKLIYCSLFLNEINGNLDTKMTVTPILFDFQKISWNYWAIERGQIKSNQTNYFIVRLKVDQRAGHLILPHLGITKTEKIELKHKTDDQIRWINPVNGGG